MFKFYSPYWIGYALFKGAFWLLISYKAPQLLGTNKIQNLQSKIENNTKTSEKINNSNDNGNDDDDEFQSNDEDYTPINHQDNISNPITDSYTVPILHQSASLTSIVSKSVQTEHNENYINPIVNESSTSLKLFDTNLIKFKKIKELVPANRKRINDYAKRKHYRDRIISNFHKRNLDNYGGKIFKKRINRRDLFNSSMYEAKRNKNNFKMIMQNLLDSNDENNDLIMENNNNYFDGDDDNEDNDDDDNYWGII